DLGREVSAALGAPDLRVAVVPHPIGGLDRSEVTARGHRAFSDIMSALKAPREQSAKIDAVPVARELDVAGSWESINDHFYREGWTDGLPIVPPDRTKVQAFIEAAGIGADRVVGIVPPRMGIATVEKITV